MSTMVELKNDLQKLGHQIPNSDLQMLMNVLARFNGSFKDYNYHLPEVEVYQDVQNVDPSINCKNVGQRKQLIIQFY
ncbi:hypothetical protein L2E82_41979 [Cichorium intybus]|uniref:Uncharacterized protein n=1 Tax=Cichorium intybus TaxID=13427 RepID=A0ACB8ZL27_CICIN|nr:hypothetical protein L2E82_41979 [Cichorium intybus]